MLYIAAGLWGLYVCVFLWMRLTGCLPVYHSVYQAGYCQFLFVVLCVCLPISICDFGVLCLDQSTRGYEGDVCSLLCCLFVCLESEAIWFSECQTDLLITGFAELNYWLLKSNWWPDECLTHGYQLTEPLVNWLCNRQTRWPTVRQAEWQMIWQNNEPGGWLTERLMRRLTEWMTAA